MRCFTQPICWKVDPVCSKASYSSELSPCEFWLFQKMKMKTKEKTLSPLETQELCLERADGDVSAFWVLLCLGEAYISVSRLKVNILNVTEFWSRFFLAFVTYIYFSCMRIISWTLARNFYRNKSEGLILWSTNFNLNEKNYKGRRERQENYAKCIMIRKVDQFAINFQCTQMKCTFQITSITKIQ